MNNVFVYCEIEGTQVQEVSQELLTKGRKLANTLGVAYRFHGQPVQMLR